MKKFIFLADIILRLLFMVWAWYVYTNYWADWTAPKEIQLECSVDGTTWTNLGRADISALTGDAKSFFGLKKAYPARYVRYTVTKPVSRTSITEFYAFEDAAEATADDIFSGATE